MNAFGRVAAIILAGVLIFLYPLQYLAFNQEAVLDSHINSLTNRLADDVMLQGYLTKDMYNDYLQKLDASNELYDIELVHGKLVGGYETGKADSTERVDLSTKLTEPKNMKVSESKNISNNGIFINTSSRYDVEGNWIPDKEEVEPKGFTTLSIRNKAYNLATAEKKFLSGFVQATNSHIHSDACYGDEIYAVEKECSGTLRSDRIEGMSLVSDWIGIGIPSLLQSVYQCTCGKKVILLEHFDAKSQLVNSWTIEIVGNEYEKWRGDFQKVVLQGIANANATAVLAVGGFICTGTEEAASYTITNLIALGYKLIPTSQTIYRNYTYMKPSTLGWPYYTLEFVTGTKHYTFRKADPICNMVVTSITTNSPTQNVKQGEGINTTATATYLDGHTATVNCSSNYNGNVGIQNVTLTYSGLVYNAKTYGSVSCTTTVTTKSKKVPVNLTITPSSYTVYNGSEPTYTVVLNYDDGTSNVIYSNYWKSELQIGAGIRTVNFSYFIEDRTVYGSVTITVKRNTKVCTNGHTYELDDYDNDLGCPVCKLTLKSISVAPEYLTVEKGADLPITLTATYMDGHTETITSGWADNYENSKIGNQLVTITYQGKTTYVSVTVVNQLVCPICGKEYEPNADGSNPGCPICKNTVISISATPDKQVVPLGEELNLEVEATYKDGHHAYTKGWSSNFNPYHIGTQEVTVFYDTSSTHVTVIVESENQTTCPICGNVYNPVLYPNGCPVCSNILIGIQAKLRNGGTQVQYGSELNLGIIKIYKDGSRVMAYSGWSATGYQPELLGVQTITVTYQEFTTTLVIEVVNTLSKAVCPNGHVYYLNEDGTDPGCPYCNETAETNQSQDYCDCVYTKTILDDLYEKGIYYFAAGDYFTITINLKTTSFLQKLRNMFSQTTVSDMKYSYGGQIHGESV